MRIFLTLFTLLFALQAYSADCRWNPKTLNRIEKNRADIWFFEIPNQAILHSNVISKDNAYVAFRKFVETKVNTDAKYLIQRQTNLFKRLPETYAEGINASDAVRMGKIGNIRSINCFESLMFNEHIKRVPVQIAPSEYGAHVLYKGSTLRVLYISEKNEKSVEFYSEVKEMLLQSLKEGWKGYFHIHSHPFALTANELDVIGSIVPSLPDFNVFDNLLNDYGFKGARITNGFDTFYINLSKENLAKASVLRTPLITK